MNVHLPKNIFVLNRIKIQTVPPYYFFGISFHFPLNTIKDKSLYLYTVVDRENQSLHFGINSVREGDRK